MTQSCCSYKFAFLFWYAEIRFRIHPLSEPFLKIRFNSFQKTFHTFQFLSDLLQKQINSIKNQAKFGDKALSIILVKLLSLSIFCLEGSSWRSAIVLRFSVLLPLMVSVYDENILLESNYQKDFLKLILRH